MPLDSLIFIPPKIPTMKCIVVGLVQEKDPLKGFYSALL